MLSSRSILSRLITAITIYALFSPLLYAANTSKYIYRDTQELVNFVDKAHDLLIKKGKGAFSIFSKDKSEWRHYSQYIFVYDEKGNCLYNPNLPNLVGKNLMSLRDLNNKPVIKEIVNIAKRGGDNASGWVFYSWPNPSTLSSEWKSTYARKVVLADGTTWIVGSGLYNIKIEPHFVTERVNDAATLIEKEGISKAVSAFRKSGGKFVFLGIYLFVIDLYGNPIFHPGFPSSADENLCSFRDAIGEHPIAILLNKLKSTDTGKVQFLYTGSGESAPQKRLCYAHKTATPNKQEFIVGACYSLERPIWLQ